MAKSSNDAYFETALSDMAGPGETVEMRVTVELQGRLFDRAYRMPKGDFREVGPVSQPHPEDRLGLMMYHERLRRRREMAAAIGVLIGRRLLEAIDAEESDRSK